MSNSPIQDELIKILDEKGVIYNLGRKYKEYSASPKMVTNNRIMNFIDKVKNKYNNVELIMGTRNGLDTSTLKVGNRKEGNIYKTYQKHGILYNTVNVEEECVTLNYNKNEYKTIKKESLCYYNPVIKGGLF